MQIKIHIQNLEGNVKGSILSVNSYACLLSGVFEV